MPKVEYTDAQKIAYYKKKANAGKKQGYSKKEDGSDRKYIYKPRNAPTKRYKRREAGVIASIGNSLGGAAGSLVGPAGSAIGGFLGGKIGHLIENITGFGDYKVMSNSIIKGGMNPPSIVNTINKGGVIIRHREYLGDITATTAFTVRKYPINPGLSVTFPWLSQVATNYEQYKLRGMIMEFKSTSSDSILSSATSSALGSIVMSTDYDIADPTPADKRTMLNNEYSSSAKPSESFIHMIECKKSQSAQNMFYTRNTSVPANFDARLYDFANFYVATEGMQADGGVCGELWITFEVELQKQQLSTNGQTDHYRLGAVTNTAPLGTAAIGSNLGNGGTIGGLLNGPGTTYSFPELLGTGKYLISYVVVGGSTAVSAPAITITNGIQSNYWTNNLNYKVSDPAATISTACIINFTMQITKQNASFTLSTGTLPTSIVSGDLWVTRIADSII